MHRIEQEIVEAYDLSQTILTPKMAEELDKQGIKYDVDYSSSFIAYCGESNYNQMHIRLKEVKKWTNNGIDINTMLIKTDYKYYIGLWKYNGEHYFSNLNYVDAEAILKDIPYIVAKALEFIKGIPLPDEFAEREKAKEKQKSVEEKIKDKPMNYQLSIFDFV